MMNAALAIVLAAQTAIGASEPAAPPTSPPKVASKTVKPKNPNEMICRGDTGTGHHISATTCKTRLEWAEQENASSHYLDHNYHTFGQGLACPIGQPGCS